MVCVCVCVITLVATWLWRISMHVSERQKLWAHFTAACLKHRCGQEAVVEPLVWHKWRHPSHALVSLWSNRRKRLARSLVCDVQWYDAVMCMHMMRVWSQRFARSVWQHNRRGTISIPLRSSLYLGDFLLFYGIIQCWSKLCDGCYAGRSGSYHMIFVACNVGIDRL